VEYATDPEGPLTAGMVRRSPQRATQEVQMKSSSDNAEKSSEGGSRKNILFKQLFGLNIIPHKRSITS
jgi:hypothetical protein